MVASRHLCRPDPVHSDCTAMDGWTTEMNTGTAQIIADLLQWAALWYLTVVTTRQRARIDVILDRMNRGVK